MKKKARKIRIWCKESPFQISCFSHDSIEPLIKIGNKMFSTSRTGYKRVIKDGRERRIPIKINNILTPTKHKLPSLVKCPDCKKRFKPRVRECWDYGCWHVYVPAHKKEVKVKDAS